ncbi:MULTISPECIES: hypothetical protein [unclassified Enterococcus]|uniref:hypothetical protein n=1 Tax=unclassified Enterococcus TaxID=2608891 RepID=UPI001CE130D2|nr:MULTISPECIES: hypothetical protein [unclassified Enterococcus]MCA5014571.1 hypothetical protein [Enterococcus sp. S23]MCA5017824.1 hypothetical protein [Enterococcus sp. S22(2020)]
MFTKERKRELKKLYKATQEASKIQKELAEFAFYLIGWIQSFPEYSEKDVKLLESINYVIEQQEISFVVSTTLTNKYTVKEIKKRLTQQHLELAKVLSVLTECGFADLPSWHSDTWTVAPIINLFTDIEYVLTENELEIIPL